MHGNSATDTLPAGPAKPEQRPVRPHFSCGPCAKPPGWSPDVLKAAVLGRSHRSTDAKARLGAVISRSRALLNIPADFRLAIVPASDTGAMEMALWSLLGPRGVDVLAWENFGNLWVHDVVRELALPDVRVFTADYGRIPDLSAVAGDRDLVFTWNGTAGGVRVPNGNWIGAERSGLTVCDATSAAFAMALPWDKLDVVTWSWQKALGGEAAHGMLAIGPRAAQRLREYSPPWPMPKLFRMVTDGALHEALWQGQTINTPSLMCVEDCLYSLAWAESIGGLPALITRSRANMEHVTSWVARTGWVEFLCRDAAIRSPTSICLTLDSGGLPGGFDLPGRMVSLLAAEGVAYDINAYATAPPGLRLWGGPTVEPADMAALLPWLDWAYGTARAEAIGNP